MSTTNGNGLVEVYLFFSGRCDEAINFYRASIGAEIEFLMRYNEAPEGPPPGMLPAGFEKKVMHASLRVGNTRIMASDGCEIQNTKFNGFSLSLTVPTEAEAKRAFNALAEGGSVTMPLGKTFWSPLFGMVEDRFGIGWMVTLPAPTAN